MGELPICERLRENIIADAYEARRLTDGVLADRLIRERHSAADIVEALVEALEKIVEEGSGQGWPTGSDGERMVWIAQDAIARARSKGGV